MPDIFNCLLIAYNENNIYEYVPTIHRVIPQNGRDKR